jgi:hypothetical protein
MGDILRYARGGESYRILDNTPLYQIDLSETNLSKTKKNEQYLVYDSLRDPEYHGKRAHCKQ